MRNPQDGKSATGDSAAIRILLVDDYEPWRHFVVSKVNKMSGLEIVGEVADGIEAIEEALELKPDLILLDIGLPNLSGIEVARRVAEMLPRTKIVFLTQNSDKELMLQCLSNGGMGYLVKGDAGGELLPAIEAVMQGSQYISKRMKRD
jgi:DNA-binding NarL/FixJ family response regulator